jgi:hypothetical protein
MRQRSRSFGATSGRLRTGFTITEEKKTQSLVAARVELVED